MLNTDFRVDTGLHICTYGQLHPHVYIHILKSIYLSIHHPSSIHPLSLSLSLSHLYSSSTSPLSDHQLDLSFCINYHLLQDDTSFMRIEG